MAQNKQSTQEQPSENPKDGAALDEVLTALQKSLSRVSAGASTVPKENALSIITGPVSFSMTLKAHPAGDRLLVKPDGEVDLTVSGVIHQDVRAKAADASNSGNEK